MWSKSLTDLFPLLFVIAIFYWIANLYSSSQIYLVYYVTTILSNQCTQCLARIGAIIFHRDPKLALLFAFTLFTIFTILGNSLFLIKELHYSLQILSSISFIRWSFESLLLIIYGFDRCSEEQFSSVLHVFQIDSSDFWPDIINLIIVTVFLNIITFILLIIKTKSSFDGNRSKTLE